VLPRALNAGHLEAGALVSRDFFGGSQPGATAKLEAERATARRTGVCPLLCPREQGRKGDVTEHAKPRDRSETDPEAGAPVGSDATAFRPGIWTVFQDALCEKVCAKGFGS
jgi:hypothetical protein